MGSIFNWMMVEVCKQRDSQVKKKGECCCFEAFSPALVIFELETSGNNLGDKWYRIETNGDVLTFDLTTGKS